MPRKKNVINDSYYEPFPTALRTIMQDNGTTQQELSSVLGVSRQAIGYYCDGTSSPDFENLVKIANYFNISTDYLLGISNDRKRTPAAADELGLSEKTIDGIKGLDRLSKYTIDRIFESEVSRTGFSAILQSISTLRLIILTIMSPCVNLDEEAEAINYATELFSKSYPDYPLCIIDTTSFVEFKVFESCTHFERILKDSIGYDVYEKHMTELQYSRRKQMKKDIGTVGG